MLNAVSIVPWVEARAIGQPKLSGASVPLSMTCAGYDTEGEIVYNEYVVKCFADHPLKTRGLAREFIASLLGQVLGLNIPAIAVVQITPELCAAARVTQWAEKICNSVGPNFGSWLVVHPFESKDIRDSLIPLTVDVFAFDMLIQNLDRNARKPNLFQSKAGLILIDHEKTFLCADPAMALGGVPEPWDFSTLSPQNHLCYRKLKQQSIAFDSFAQKLSSITEKILDEIFGQLPTEWSSPEIEHIRNHLIKARNNADKFKRSLQEVLV